MQPVVDYVILQKKISEINHPCVITKPGCLGYTSLEQIVETNYSIPRLWFSLSIYGNLRKKEFPRQANISCFDLNMDIIMFFLRFEK